MKCWKKLVGIFRKPKTPSVYIGECEDEPELSCGQITLTRYRDFTPIGEWGTVDAGGVPVDGGKMLSETVKYKDKDGVIRLGTDWVADNDKHVTGFDP
jgi:hypothetical protein